MGSQLKRPRAQTSRQLQVPRRARETHNLTTDNALSYLKTIKVMFQDKGDKYEEFLELVKYFKTQRIDTKNFITRVEELFKGHPNLILGLSIFLPGGFKIINFINKIKTRFQDDNRMYKSFLDIVNMYPKEKKSPIEIYKKAAKLFCHNQDLLEEFKHFLPVDSLATSPTKDVQSNCNSSFLRRDGRSCSPMHKRARNTTYHVERRINVKCSDPDHDKSMCHKKKRDRKEDNKRDRDRENVGPNGHKMSLPNKDMAKLDIFEHQSCNPNYVFLPENYRTTAGCWSEIGAKVLNDIWAVGTSATEDHSFKEIPKSQEEEIMFLCEDDRFEMDMLLEWVNGAKKHVEKLLNRINNNTIKSNGSIHIEDHFTAANIWCIERLYGDHGLDVVDVLRNNATRALPVILNRLKQKQEELSRLHSDLNKDWAEVHAKNYPNSLDHRGFYFKQQNTESLNVQRLNIAELKSSSVSQRRRIKELETQLHGAKDTATDLRGQVKGEQDDRERMKNNQVHTLDEQIVKASDVSHEDASEADKVNT